VCNYDKLRDQLMAIPTIAPFSSSSSDPFARRWILDKDATRHVCSEPNMFDDDNKTTLWVVFSSANKHNIKSTPRRLVNVFYNPRSLEGSRALFIRCWSWIVLAETPSLCGTWLFTKTQLSPLVVERLLPAFPSTSLQCSALVLSSESTRGRRRG
jgi:hypothetical protein